MDIYRKTCSYAVRMQWVIVKCENVQYWSMKVWRTSITNRGLVRYAKIGDSQFSTYFLNSQIFQGNFCIQLCQKLKSKKLCSRCVYKLQPEKHKPKNGQVFTVQYRHRRWDICPYCVKTTINWVPTHIIVSHSETKSDTSIQSKRQEIVSTGVVLLNETARPHMATTETRALGWEAFNHPPYNTVLAPSDYTSVYIWGSAWTSSVSTLMKKQKQQSITGYHRWGQISRRMYK